MSTPDTAEKGLSGTGIRYCLEFQDAFQDAIQWEDDELQRSRDECMANLTKQRALLHGYIAQLELEARRLQVLEELARASRLDVMEHPEVGPLIVVADLGSFDTLREAADAEILRRSNTGDTNG